MPDVIRSVVGLGGVVLALAGAGGMAIALFRQHERWRQTKGPLGSERTLVSENFELYVVDADGSHLRRLTHTPKKDEF